MLFVSGLWVTASAAEQNAGTPNAVAARIAGDIARKIQSAYSHLDVISARDDIRQLFMNADQAALQEMAAALAPEIDGTMKLRLLLPGQYDVEPEAIPPLGYASLDLLHKAEKSAAPLPAEVHGHGGPAAHVIIIHRVEDADNNLIGLLHLSLAPETYLQLPAMETGTGYAELHQTLGANVLNLGKTGDAKLRSGNPVKAGVKGTHFAINYWNGDAAGPKLLSGQSFTGKIANLPLVPVTLTVFIIGLAVGGFLLYRMKKISGGQGEVSTEEEVIEVVYSGAVKAIMEGKHAGLEKLVPGLAIQGLSRSAHPVSQGPSGSDITASLRPAPEPSSAAGKPPTPAPQIKPVAATGAPAQPAQVKQAPLPAAATAEPVIHPLEATVPMPEKEAPAEEPVKAPPSSHTETIPPIIFRAYDIRGIVGKSLTVKGVYEIGRAIGSEAVSSRVMSIAVGRDGRTSSPELAGSLTEGLRAAGANVIDIGVVPTPLLYFATHHLKTGSGVMVTGSHNGPAYNGLKIMLGGDTLAGDAIQALRKRIETGNMSSGQGTVETVDVTAAYLRRATEDVPVALGNALKIIVDCGNGVAGMIAPQLYRALGHDVEEMYCKVDGTFPNHHPDPSQPENLQELIARVRKQGADLGLAFDGDGDRLGVIDSNGTIIWPDRQLMLYARDVLNRNAGAPVIYDVKCSRHMKSVIETSGGRPVMWKTGHSFIKNKMKELDAPLAGEMSGHIFFKERWFGFDDALYTGVRLLEILGKHKMKSAEVFAGLPGGVATPELRIMLAEKNHSKFMQDLRAKANFKDAEIHDIDGMRVEFQNGWGLIRPSNTTPCLIARFEADDSQGLVQIQASFRELIQAVSPELKLPF